MSCKTLLIVDGNQQICDSLAGYFEKKQEFTVLDPAIDGQLAVKSIRANEPDIVLMDIVLPQMDGFEGMHEMQGMKLGRKPDIVIQTCLRRDDFIIRAISLGACYYIVKPFDYEVLYTRLKEVAEGSVSASLTVVPQPAVHSLDEKLANMFLIMGIPAHIKGYLYLREAVKLVVNNYDIINRITKELYPTVARRFGTTPSKVERAIRHAIEVAWNRGRIENINQVFGYMVYTSDDKPTNGEFIALIADKLSVGRDMEETRRKDPTLPPTA